MPFNVRMVNLNNFPQNSNGNSKKSTSTAIHKMKNMPTTSVEKCLSLLRKNLQLSINEKIKMLLDDYKKVFEI